MKTRLSDGKSGWKASPRRPCSPPPETCPVLSRNGVARTWPFSNTKTRPSCSATNSRPLPSPALATASGRPGTTAIFDSLLVTWLGSQPDGVGAGVGAGVGGGVGRGVGAGVIDGAWETVALASGPADGEAEPDSHGHGLAVSAGDADGDAGLLGGGPNVPEPVGDSLPWLVPQDVPRIASVAMTASARCGPRVVITITLRPGAPGSSEPIVRRCDGAFVAAPRC